MPRAAPSARGNHRRRQSQRPKASPPAAPVSPVSPVSPPVKQSRDDEEGEEDKKDAAECSFRRFVNHRWASNSIEIQVEWEDGDVTWEPEANLHADALESLLQYWSVKGGRPTNPLAPDMYDIFAIRKHSKDRRRLMVEWVGYGPKDASWIRRSVVEDTAPQLVKDYWKTVTSRALGTDVLAVADPGVHMFNQATMGPVDVITGDYLAEATVGVDAMKRAEQTGPGWVPTALDGIEISLDVINEKRIKIIVNGGSVNPRGLAEKVQDMVSERKLNLRVAYVDGDDLLPKLKTLIDKTSTSKRPLPHLDGHNDLVKLGDDLLSFLDDPETMPVLAANAYLGYRAIKQGLDRGADIIICGRVADASPVIAAAAWWYEWAESDFDRLAGALIAGHLIECSTYVTGANFAGAFRHPPSTFVNMGLPIAEISVDGDCVVTKHDGTGGLVNVDTVRCQLLYELQGNIYLNSDVKADIQDIQVTPQGKDRVHVTGVKGFPPPPTTKLAIFYRGGYQLEVLLNATGYATDHKWEIQEAQIRSKLQEWGTLDKLDILEFQRVGTPQENPDSQLNSTTYIRIYAQGKDAQVVASVTMAWIFTFMAHFAGMNGYLENLRRSIPTEFVGYYPALVSQTEIQEAVTILSGNSSTPPVRLEVGPPKVTQELAARENYETSSPKSLDSFGPKTMRPLGDVVLARSGDKGANINLGLFVHTADQYDWLRSFMTRDKLKAMMRKDWREEYYIERVEMPRIRAVHFVVYGPLGRGVSSSSRLDCLGKGFAEFIRAVWVPLPTRFLQEEAAKL
ncbi:hypothetical protein CP532_2598 [Ophiocordyceps camponoti-leonardi (nom. inval.)]|nr:hypothetical protein CP532_2598 [Ophiocordyceps camponoti-leonardi (nom. inval.)]